MAEYCIYTYINIYLKQNASHKYDVDCQKEKWLVFSGNMNFRANFHSLKNICFMFYGLNKPSQEVETSINYKGKCEQSYEENIKLHHNSNQGDGWFSALLGQC